MLPRSWWRDLGAICSTSVKWSIGLTRERSVCGARLSACTEPIFPGSRAIKLTSHWPCSMVRHSVPRIALVRISDSHFFVKWSRKAIRRRTPAT